MQAKHAHCVLQTTELCRLNMLTVSCRQRNVIIMQAKHAHCVLLTVFYTDGKNDKTERI